MLKHRSSSSRRSLSSPTATSASASSTGHGQARAGTGAPQQRDDDVPQHGNDVLAGAGGSGEFGDGVNSVPLDDLREFVDDHRRHGPTTPPRQPGMVIGSPSPVHAA
jgi:hypothetical protein